MIRTRAWAAAPEMQAAPVASQRASWRAWTAGWLVWATFLAATGAYHWSVAVAHPDQPHRFLLIDRLFDAGVAVSILAAGFLLGLGCLRAVRLVAWFGRLEVFALATGLGLGVLSLMVLALGMLHLYYPVTLAVLVLGLPWLLARERQQAMAFLGAARDALGQLRTWRGPALMDSVASPLLAALCLCMVCLTFVRDLVLPAIAWDTYQYHWAVPMLLLHTHSMRGFPGWAHANLPYNTEMLNLIALSVQAPEAALMVQDAFLVLSAVLVFAMVRRHFGVTTAWLATLAALTVPLLLLYASVSYVETALVFYGFAALAVLIRWLEHVAATDDPGYRLLLLAGLFVGLDIGVKYTAIQYLPGMLLLVLAGVWHVGRRKHAGTHHILSRVTQSLAVFGGSATLVFAPWPLKNWLLLGNPVYPALASIFPTALWSPVRDQALVATFHNFGIPNGWTARLHLYALDLFLHPRRYGEGWTAPVGWIGLTALLVVPYLMISLRPAWRARVRVERGQFLVVAALALTAVLGFAAWTFSGALVARYAVPPVMLATVVGATIIGWTAARASRRAAPIAWLVLCGVLIVCANQGWSNLVSSGGRLAPQYTDIQARVPLNLLLGKISEQTYEHSTIYSDAFWQMTDYVNGQLPHDGKLLMLGRGTGYFFQDREYVADSGEDWVPYLVSTGETPDGILQVLRSQGFTYVVYDANLMHFITDTYGNHVVASSLPSYLSFQQSKLIPIAQWRSFSLYRVPNADTAAQRHDGPRVSMPVPRRNVAA